MLVDGLPDSSRLYRDVHGHDGYTLERELLFSVLDALQGLMAVTGGVRNAPALIRRPWQSLTEQAAETATVTALRAWKQRHKEAIRAG